MRLFLIVIILLSCGLLEAQIVKEFYDKNGRPADEQHSYFYRVGAKKVSKKRTEAVFIDTVKTFFTASNKIRSREYYADGQKNGSFTTYFENGAIKDKGTYREGLATGRLTSWYETGAMQSELNIEHGQIEIINYWDEFNVQLVKDGSGYCFCYLYAGELLKEGKVVKGTLDSTWRYLSGDTVKFIVEFNKGKVLKVTKPSRNAEVKDNGQSTAAEFPEGTSALTKFLERNIRYPEQAKRMGIEGRVYTKFMVETDGSITEITIMKGINDDLNNEAIRIIKSMPLWQPATREGIPVRSQALLPITFNLKR